MPKDWKKSEKDIIQNQYQDDLDQEEKQQNKEVSTHGLRRGNTMMSEKSLGKSSEQKALDIDKVQQLQKFIIGSS